MDPGMCSCVVALLVQVHPAAEDIDIVFCTKTPVLFGEYFKMNIRTKKIDPYIGAEHEPRKIGEI